MLWQTEKKCRKSQAYVSFDSIRFSGWFCVRFQFFNSPICEADIKHFFVVARFFLPYLFFMISVSILIRCISVFHFPPYDRNKICERKTKDTQTILKQISIGISFNNRDEGREKNRFSLEWALCLRCDALNWMWDNAHKYLIFDLNACDLIWF